ncbi:hypothetical protein OEZ86_003496 [Tetradesmus obliquus]|nr:hypothetical protein OEZ86_003496 [Tetradesmus obliquus]
MLQEGRTDKFETYQPGSFVSVNLPSKTSEDGTGRGDIYAPSIARIEAVFEDRRGCCHVALRYFWRWGQIHKDGDLHHALRPSHRAQLFLQKEVTLRPAGTEGRAGPGSYNTLRFADGCFKELLPAIQLNGLVTVLPKAVVLQQWGGAGGDEAAALARYEANWGSQGAGVDPISGARSNGFWFQYTFDPTCYSFETAYPEDLPAIKLPGKKQKQHGRVHTGSSQDAAAAGGDKFKRLPKELGLTMGDAFCGMGTVSIAANEVGWQVEFGIDSNRDALASFRANTSHSAAAPFNAVTGRPPADLPPLRVEQAVAQARSGRLALPAVDWLHLSPPCQNVSQKKSLEQRVFSGAELTSALELVGMLQPSFVTLEEVLGFLAQKFLPQNLKGVLAGFPNEPSAPEHSSSSAADAAADDSEDEDTDGEEDEDGGGSEDDQEGEGLADVAGEDGTEEDAAAAGDSSSRPGAGAAVLLNPVLMVVAGLLDQGYQVRLCLLNAAHYGVPQNRWRVVLLAAKHGCQLPEPPPPRYTLPEGASSKPRVPAADTGFLVKAGATGGKAYSDWREVLAVTPEDPGGLPPAITLQEACGDLPPLNPPCCTHKAAAAAADQQQCYSGAGHSGTAAGGQQQPAGSSAAAPRQAAVWLGEEVARYRPEAGIMNCPLPVDALQGRGCTPVSLFAKWARSPHAAHHALRGFDASLLHDHCVQHPNSAKLAQLLAAPEWDAAASPADRALVEAMNAKEREKLKHGGQRLAADGLMACVLGHNDPGMRFCVHFVEDRYLSLAERRRGQSLPDWVAIHGSKEQARQQQVRARVAVEAAPPLRL